MAGVNKHFNEVPSSYFLFSVLVSVFLFISYPSLLTSIITSYSINYASVYFLTISFPAFPFLQHVTSSSLSTLSPITSLPSLPSTHDFLFPIQVSFPPYLISFSSLSLITSYPQSKNPFPFPSPSGASLPSLHTSISFSLLTSSFKPCLTLSSFLSPLFLSLPHRRLTNTSPGMSGCLMHTKTSSHAQRPRQDTSYEGETGETDEY